MKIRIRLAIDQPGAFCHTRINARFILTHNDWIVLNLFSFDNTNEALPYLQSFFRKKSPARMLLCPIIPFPVKIRKSYAIS